MALGFYNESYRAGIPHAPIRVAVLLVVEKAISAAWKLVKTTPRPGFVLVSATEDEITHELYEVLYDRVFNKGVVAGFDRQLFSAIDREPKLRSYNYKYLDKMPDILVRLVGRPRSVRNTQDGLFIECKPVDVRHAVGGQYCKKGLARFTRGEYAWAMRNAMMIGYTMSGYTILPKLRDALLKAPWRKSNMGLPLRCAYSRPTSESQVVYATVHRRRFRYKETGNLAPPIIIRHLWLQRE